MNDLEREIIEAAIEFVNQQRHGLFTQKAIAENDFYNAVDALIDENDGRWVAK